MRTARRPAALLSLATALILGAGLAACSVGGDDGTRVSFSPTDTAARALALGEGDVAVTSTDNTVVLALVGDTVRMQLSDSLRQSVAAEVDSSLTEETGALGGMIARTVGKTVAGAMGFVVRIPVQEVEDVRYEEGKIRFESRGNVKFSMGDDKHRTSGDSDEKASGARFSEEDGRRFVEAVKQRQAERSRNL